ncbi:MAG: Aminopeptidase 2 mitochondrial, partial [Tremellales sp. Tagirdzhanova-0007]
MAEAVLGGSTPSAGTSNKYRLPTTVSPKHYDLIFKTDLSSSPPQFSGEALITLDVHSDTPKLIFNLSSTLKISHIAIASSDLKTESSMVLSLSALSIDESQERGTLDLTSLPSGGLKAGSKGVKVWMAFEAELAGTMTGYYKSEGDPDDSGMKPVYALTQFESTSRSEERRVGK